MLNQNVLDIFSRKANREKKYIVKGTYINGTIVSSLRRLCIISRRRLLLFVFIIRAKLQTGFMGINWKQGSSNQRAALGQMF